MKTIFFWTSIALALFVVFCHANEDDTAAKKQTKNLKILYIKRDPDCQRLTKSGDHISIHYVGKYEKDNVVFDSSRDKDQPFELQLGKHTFGKGLDVGLADMCVGDKREIIVPHNMAFGNRGTDKVQGGLTLIFEVELLNIYHSAELADLIVENKVNEDECKRKTKKGDLIKIKTHFQEENQFGYRFVNTDEPDEITIGLGRAFPGFDAGLMDMCVGETRKLYIRMVNGIVWCRIDLLEIKDNGEKKVEEL